VNVVLRNRWLALVVVVCLGAVTACGGDEEEPSSQESSSQSSDSEGSGDAGDLDDVPDVVAEVNGEEIDKETFVQAYEAQQQQAAAAAAQGGEAPDEEQLRQQVVDSLVTQELLAQEAAARDIEPTDEQVEKTLTTAAQQSGMQSADELIKALEDQGLDAEEVDEQATRQTSFELLIADEAGPIKASAKEVKRLYDQVSQQSQGQGSEVPPLKQVRAQLEDQVESQQESQAADALISRLREDAEITINV
jgi:peptidyl-prolyl cis-trans isomerase SurA